MDQFLSRNYLIVNEEVACEKINFSNAAALRNIRKYQHKISCIERIKQSYIIGNGKERSRIIIIIINIIY
jgi:hypothetical protein